MSDDDATYYSDRIGQGGVFVSVDSDASLDRQSAQDILRNAGGHISAQAKMETATIY